MAALSRHDQEAVGRQMETMQQIGSGMDPAAFGMLLVVFQFLVEIVKAVTLSVEMIVRKDFGIRYLTPIRFIFGLGFIWALQAILALIFGLDASFGLFVLFLVIIFYLHRRSISRKFWKQGIVWYTYSFGVSRFDWIITRARQFNVPKVKNWNDWTLYRFVEPGYIFLLGFWMRPISPALGYYLLIAAFGLFIKNQWEFMQEQGRFLDLIDARIISEFQRDALSGRPKEETKGYSVVTPPQDVTFDIDLAAPASSPTRDSNGQQNFGNTLDEMLAPASK